MATPDHHIPAGRIDIEASMGFCGSISRKGTDLFQHTAADLAAVANSSTLDPAKPSSGTPQQNG